MARETAAQRKARISLLLGEYDARSREFNKLAKEVKSLKEQVRKLKPGTYGEFVYAHGKTREVVDQEAIKEDYAARGVDMPTKWTAPAIVVTVVAK